MTFNIRAHIELDQQGRAICPSCALTGRTDKTLSVLENGAYKCFRGCTPGDIRSALGEPKDQQIPDAIARPSAHHIIPAPAVTITPQKVKESHDRLMASNGPAKEWLRQRGITDAMMERHRLGITRAKVGDRHLPAITIAIPNHDGTAYYQKKRIAPWLAEEERPPEYRPWSQKSVPAKVWFTWRPAEATATYLCEGEWDAIVLGWMMRHAEQPIAVASFTCGCGTVPPQDELDQLLGRVTVFYDRNDKPNKQGLIPGEHGAKKVAEALGDRGSVGLVPMPDDCRIKGWDVSDAIAAGYGVNDFIAAAGNATRPQPPQKDNPLRARLTWNDDLIAAAPDYTEWLVPDLFTANELFLLASGPRMGKSLFSMTLARSIASGEPFLGRPVMKGTVLFVCLEDSPAKIKEREQAQQWTEGLPVVWLNKFKLSELNYLREIVQELDPRLVIIDTLSRAKDNSISESSAEMSQVLEPLQEIAGDLETCVLLVHHTGKISAENAGQVDIFDTIRGSSAIRAVCRGSAMIAAGERDFRLVAENGWGKHDLKILLDAHTLTWKLLGKWNPDHNQGQSDQVIEYLKGTQSATLDEMSEVLQIPKMSLYKVLERLQTSDIAEEKVIKTGMRRNYRYSLALFHSVKPLFDNLHLSNSLSNSANTDSESVRGGYLTKSSSFLEKGVISDHPSVNTTGQSDHFTIVNKEVINVPQTQSGEEFEGEMYTSCTEPLKPAPSKDSRSVITPSVEKDGSLLSNRDTQGGSSSDSEGDLPIGQLFDKGDFVKYTDEEKTAAAVITTRAYYKSSDHSTPRFAKVLNIGDRVRILVGQLQMKPVTVVSFAGNLVEVKGDRWLISRFYKPEELQLIKRAGEESDT